ncbi:unnamed protein product [Moneuplotes crassus]|uniref:Uncharacterized protein n=1 Tax=Euplotes crassus TaxID=5936 RepID=A0AAD1UB25_EUPCR|nr:unnamed protein product [Moneuplotes crassus]
MKLQKHKLLLKALRILPLCDLLHINIINITKRNFPALKTFLMNSFPRKVRGLEIFNTQRSNKIIERYRREISNASHKVTSYLGLCELKISRPSLMRLFSENKNKRSLKFTSCILNAEEIPDFTRSLDRSTISKLEFNKCSIIGPSMTGKGFDGIESLIQGFSKSTDFKDSLKHLDFYPLENEELLDDLLITNNFNLAYLDSI